MSHPYTVEELLERELKMSGMYHEARRAASALLERAAADRDTIKRLTDRLRTLEGPPIMEARCRWSWRAVLGWSLPGFWLRATACLVASPLIGWFLTAAVCRASIQHWTGAVIEVASAAWTAALWYLVDRVSRKPRDA